MTKTIAHACAGLTAGATRAIDAERSRMRSACLGVHMTKILVVAFHNLGAQGMVARVTLRIRIRHEIRILQTTFMFWDSCTEEERTSLQRTSYTHWAASEKPVSYR